MKTLRRNIVLKEGGEIAMLFTPHLYSYKGKCGASLEYDPTNQREVYEMYTDIMYLAAVNAWVLDGKGDEDSCPFTRGDFHVWAHCNPREFGKVMAFAVECMTGKAVKQILEERIEQEGQTPVAPEGVKKKSGKNGSRWRNFWSELVGSPKNRRQEHPSENTDSD